MPRFSQLREVTIRARAFESERLRQIQRFIYQPTKGQVDRLAFGPEAIPAHHLVDQTIIQFHIGAHRYTIVAKACLTRDTIAA